jgi:hypothetical protein
MANALRIGDHLLARLGARAEASDALAMAVGDAS